MKNPKTAKLTLLSLAFLASAALSQAALVTMKTSDGSGGASAFTSTQRAAPTSSSDSGRSSEIVEQEGQMYFGPSPSSGT